MGYIFDAIRYNALELGSVAVTLMTVVATLISAIAGLRQLKSSQRKEGEISPDQVMEFEKSSDKDTKPFEIIALASYYNQALSRSTVAFWFSIVFGSIGFAVIILAFITHQNGDISGTIIKLTCGSIIDAVSTLFFVQSNTAQKNMIEFFEKLRLDRLNAEARDMIGEIENIKMRDELRAQLILKYSGIDQILTGSNLRDLGSD